MDDVNYTPRLKAALNGTAKLAPPSSTRPPQQPFTVDLLNAILACLDSTIPIDAAFKGCMTSTYWGVAWVSSLPKPTHLLTPHGMSNALTLYKQDCNGLDVTAFGIPRTKTSPHGEEVFWAEQPLCRDACPGAALRNHLIVNPLRPNAPLFAYCTPNGYLPPTCTVFNRRLEVITDLLHIENLKLHGLCVGRTLKHMLQGVPFDVVKTLGHWSLDTFHLYLCKHAIIIAPYLQNSPQLAFT